MKRLTIIVFLHLIFIIPVSVSAAERTYEEWKETVEVMHKLAKEGNVTAFIGLGEAYTIGLGVPQNYKLAFKWNLRGAEQGNANTMEKVAIALAWGMGVKRDVVRGHMWANVAATLNGENAAKIRDKIVKNMSSSQLDMD